MPISRKLLGLGVIAVLTVSGVALAQSMPDGQQMPGQSGMQHGPGMMQGHGGMGGVMHHQGMMHGAGTSQAPTEPGQAAFGAVQEIVRALEADPNTDWSKVKLSALREHLIDMDEVTLKADAAESPIEKGLQVDVTGSGRTLAAIRRMLPEHAAMINGLNGWIAKAEPLANGVRLTVTSDDPKEVARIRGLGFIGLLASGSHHQPHHLAMAKGEPIH